MGLKDRIVKWLFRDYINDYVKPVIEKTLDFFDGKKTILSLIGFGLTAYAQAHPEAATSVVLFQIIEVLKNDFGVSITLEKISVSSLGLMVVGVYKKIEKWVKNRKPKAVEA